jgi:hypothetical protein
MDCGNIRTPNAGPGAAIQGHWVLDIGFREDESRVRKDNAPENFAVLRHITINLLKQESSLKVGIKAKRMTAAWARAYLLKVLSY